MLVRQRCTNGYSGNILGFPETSNSERISYYSGKITSKDEAKDRFMDEFGSEAIWLGGIPLFKTLTDKTLFKALNYDSKYDVRNLLISHKS